MLGKRLILTIAGAGLAFALSGCGEFPPVEGEQTGFRGTAMKQVVTQGRAERLEELNQVPEPVYPLDVPEGEPLARDIYENVQVLGHLPNEQFNRLMLAITEWVSPDNGDPGQGCAYCHNLENFAEDNVYTKIVARKMFQMTWQINDTWSTHVGDVGVTCYTCHRGLNVPQYIWFENEGPPQAQGMLGWRNGNNIANQDVGTTSLPYDPFSPYLQGDQEIRVTPPKVLPSGHDVSLQDTERTYSLMIHMSEGLGVNCTYCHNSNNFAKWEGAPPARMTAWHGIRMVRDVNVNYMDVLQPVYPENRLGPLGDAPKANCTTCHQGINQPLYGVSMLPDYPSLAFDGATTGEKPQEQAAVTE